MYLRRYLEAKQNEETHAAPGLNDVVAGGGGSDSRSQQPMESFATGIPVAVAVAHRAGDSPVLTPVGVDRPLRVTLPFGVAGGKPAQVLVPGSDFGAASGTTYVFVAPRGAVAGQVVQIVVPNSGA